MFSPNKELKEIIETLKGNANTYWFAEKIEAEFYNAVALSSQREQENTNDQAWDLINDTNGAQLEMFERMVKEYYLEPAKMWQRSIGILPEAENLNVNDGTIKTENLEDWVQTMERAFEVNPIVDPNDSMGMDS